MSLIPITLVALIGLVAPPTTGKGDFLPGYATASSAPAMTASSLPPLTLNVKWQAGEDTPYPQPLVFTVTALDVDTYKDTRTGEKKEYFNPYLICQSELEQYPSIGGPTKRGTDSDGTCIWDLVVPGWVAPDSKGGSGLQTRERVYINTYTIIDPTTKDGAALHDQPRMVTRMIVCPMPPASNRANGATSGTASTVLQGSFPRLNLDDKDAQVQEDAKDTGKVAQGETMDRSRASQLLRPLLEKRLTNEEKQALAQGEFVEMRVGNLPQQLRAQVMNYAKLGARLQGNLVPPLNLSKWQDFGIRFNPGKAGTRWQTLSIIAIGNDGKEYYF